MNRQEHDAIAKLIADGYLTKDLEPLKCPKCGSTTIRISIIALDGGRISEKEANCEDCTVPLGYWAYGNWQV